MDLQPNKIDGIVKPITNTRISASEWNQLVGSCMAFITAAGFTPDANDNSQFLNAFIQIAQDLGVIGANVDLSNLTATGESHFAKPDLSNITSINTVANAIAPDMASYSTIAASTSFSAPTSGWISFVPVDNTTTSNSVDKEFNGYIQIAGKTVLTSVFSTQNDTSHPDSGWFFVGDGQTVYHTMSSGTVYFYPIKGV